MQKCKVVNGLDSIELIDRLMRYFDKESVIFITRTAHDTGEWVNDTGDIMIHKAKHADEYFVYADSTKYPSLIDPAIRTREKSCREMLLEYRFLDGGCLNDRGVTYIMELLKKSNKELSGTERLMAVLARELLYTIKHK